MGKARPGLAVMTPNTKPILQATPGLHSPAPPPRGQPCLVPPEGTGHAPGQCSWDSGQPGLSNLGGSHLPPAGPEPLGMAWHGGRRGAGSPPFSTLASASTSRAPVGSPFPLGVAGFLHPLLQRQGPPGRGSEDHPSCSEHQHPPSYREAGARAKRAEYPRTARAGNSFIGQGHRAWHAGDWTVWRERGSRRARDLHSRPGHAGAGWGRGRASGGLSGLGLGKHRVAEVALAGALGIRLPDRGLRGRGAESGAGRRRARPGEARTVPTAPSPAPPCTSGSGSPWAALPAGGPPCRASSTCGWGLS